MPDAPEGAQTSPAAEPFRVRAHPIPTEGLPCPFCGGDDLQVDIVSGGRAVTCTSCWSRGPTENGVGDTEANDEEAATASISSWNSRVKARPSLSASLSATGDLVLDRMESTDAALIRRHVKRLILKYGSRFPIYRSGPPQPVGYAIEKRGWIRIFCFPALFFGTQKWTVEFIPMEIVPSLKEACENNGWCGDNVPFNWPDGNVAAEEIDWP